MKIAQIAPLYEAVPPRLYGGTERVVAHLCDALVELGHEVTLFATAEARTRARLVAVRDKAMRLDEAPLKSDLAAHLTMLSEVRRRSRQFDVLHFHIDLLHFPMFEPYAGKSITTLHGRLDLKDLAAGLRALAAVWSGVNFRCATRTAPRGQLAADRAAWSACGAVSVPGTAERRLPRVPRAYLPREAPRSCDPAGPRGRACRCKIAAKIDAVDAHYFDAKVKPLLDDPLIEFIGEIGDADKPQFLGQASALLFPINWPEPFGLVMIEAMACGTPVIAWNCGSAPEVIEPGVSGFVVNSEAEALEAIARIPDLDRGAVRAAYERSFTSTVMANAYLDVYARLLHSHTPAIGASAAQPSRGHR